MELSDSSYMLYRDFNASPSAALCRRRTAGAAVFSKPFMDIAMLLAILLGPTAVGS
jgi:hypothetical protein